ncbi:phage minor capsid protein, partial [Clostridium nigeriense]|uniref:phage minor capsid protein n=1 Tax=Clostridium nigeriense TaxID=1805470 RepID=UPI003D3280F4
PGAVPQENNFFGVNEKKLEALISTVNNDLNKAQYSVLRKMDDVYRQTIFKSHMYLQNGAKTLYQAIDMATKDFLDKGINSIEYKNGARVNIASYAEMSLRTASHRATLLGEGKKRDEYGIHLVVVSAHGNTCRLCEPWQGQILIDDIFSHPSKEYIEQYKDKYKLLSEAIEKGLLHPNCRHSLITYFEGITTLPKVPDGKEAIRVYEAEQKQRALERQIRKWKRIEAGSVYAKNVNDAAKRVKELESQLKNHLDNNKELRRAPQRETDKIPIDKVSSSDKIIDRKWLKANFSTQKKYDRHIEKHLSEYGDITPEDYLNTARDLLAAPLSDDIEGFISEANFIYKYRHSTNDLAIGRNDKNVISTLYKPIKGYEEFTNERKLFEKKG